MGRRQVTCTAVGCRGAQIIRSKVGWHDCAHPRMHKSVTRTLLNRPFYICLLAAGSSAEYQALFATQKVVHAGHMIIPPYAGIKPSLHIQFAGSLHSGVIFPLFCGVPAGGLIILSLFCCLISWNACAAPKNPPLIDSLIPVSGWLNYASGQLGRK